MTQGERGPLRVPAALLQGAAGVLLPGYARARREPERMALLTTACLARGGPAANGGARPAGLTLFVTDTENASDVLCALWVARRSGLFQPGSSTADASGKRSSLEIVPSFASGVGPEAEAGVLASLCTNAAFRRHLEARGRATMVALAAVAS